MSEKTYIFEGGNNETTGLLNSIIPALQNKGVDTAALLAAMGNNNGGLFGGRGFEDIIALIIVAAIFGNGNGFGFGNGGNNNSAERELLANMIQRNGTDLSQLAQTLGCSNSRIADAIGEVSTQICNLAGQNGLSFQQVVNSIQSGNAALASTIANCCCDMKQLVTQQGYESQIAIANQTATLGGKIDAQTTMINDKFCQLEMREMQNKIDALREEKSTLQASISNANQTASIQAFVAQNVTPVAAAVAGLQADLNSIKCKLPETYNVPYQPFTAIPNCVAAQYGFYGGIPFGVNGGGFFG